MKMKWSPRRSKLVLSGFLLVGLLSGGGWACGGEGDNRAQEPREQRPAGPVDDTPPVETLAECGAFEGGDDLRVCTATYLGDEGEVVSVAIAANGEVILGRNAPTARLEIYAPTGSELRRAVELEGRLVAMAADGSTDQVALVVEREGLEVIVKDLAGEEVFRRQVPAGISAVAYDRGLIALLAGEEVTIWGEAGEELEELGRVELAGRALRDVAVHGELELIYVTGFRQVSGNLQQPFLMAYSPRGERQWTNWDWSEEEAGQWSSDTRGTAVGIGRDRKLYYVGESHGGVTTHFRDPRDIAEEAPILRRDPYSQSHNWNGAAPLGFVARLDPSTGEMEGGQLLAVRLSDGRGNGVSPRFVTATEEGVILLGGSSACCIERWDEKTVAGQAAMPGYGGGQWAMALSPEFDERYFWTTFHGGAPGVQLQGLDARGPVMVVAHNQRGEEGAAIEVPMITSQALHHEPAGSSAGHLVIFPAP